MMKEKNEYPDLDRTPDEIPREVDKKEEQSVYPDLDRVADKGSLLKE